MSRGDFDIRYSPGAATGCLLGGGGGGGMAKFLAEHCANPERGAQRRGGGGAGWTPTHFFPSRPENFVAKLLL